MHTIVYLSLCGVINTIMFSLTQYNACREYCTLLFLVGFTLMLSPETASDKSCAYFSFENSTVRSNSVDVTENTTVTLMFYLKNKTCNNMENVHIIIERWYLSLNNYTPYCKIVQKNGTCRNETQEDCRCLSTVGVYMFSKIVNKSDFTWWKWSTKDGIADDVYIWFNETDWNNTSVFAVVDQTSTASPTRTESNAGDEEIDLSVGLALGLFLIIIIICLLTVALIKKRDPGKHPTSAVYENADSVVQRPQLDVEIRKDDVTLTDDFTEVYFSNSFELD